ncbi:PREDICTED: glutathione S-transferase-like [Nelumbo nucifera]|uniref:glutathione transferase n=2 Tax=Nelumbo nucifera TaxID=4432 RepID=A0A1U8A0H7_NELNU|nr:PREDICTED: glutathione S-transferase-like [Nelumbo nucifera]DAD38034.1 TPA_asm: hypothetical protein HUJ06_008675 [Nelumbo nucifera]
MNSDRPATQPSRNCPAFTSPRLGSFQNKWPAGPKAAEFHPSVGPSPSIKKPSTSFLICPTISPHLINLFQSFCIHLNLSQTAMAVLKVHGSVISTAARRVLACLYEKGLDFEFVTVDMRVGDHKKEPFLALNPFGQVPAFEDGDLKLFESRAITKYLAHEYQESGTELIYKDSKKMAIQAVWMEVEAHQYDPAASKLVWELAAKPAFGMTTDAAVVEENEAKLNKVLDVYEARLSESKYLAGDCFTLADLHHLPTVTYLMGTPAKKLFESRPHVNAWCTDIMSRPAWTKVVEMQKQH